MRFDLIIEGGVVVTPAGTFGSDVGVLGGKIAAVGDLKGAEAGARHVASGQLVFPGFIDEHVHSRDPGLTHKEDFAHSTRAAAAGGITTVVEMPNTVPPVFDPASFAAQVENLSSKAFIDFALWGIVLGDRNLHELEALAEVGVVGFKLFWGYALDPETLALVYNPRPGQAVLPPPDDGQVLAAFRAIARTGRPVAIHAENAEIINRLADEERRKGAGEYGAMLRSRPPYTEAMMVEAGVRIAEAAGAHLHVLHVSSAEAIAAVAAARARGSRVTAETCPHYLLLSDEDFGRLGTSMKVYPPVRERRHQEALWRAVVRGDVEVIGSDHAPHTPEEKLGDVWTAPAGASTVQATVPLMLNAVNEGRLSPARLAAVLAENPARLLGLYPRKGAIVPGADADLVIVDMERSITLSPEAMLSKSPISPYAGAVLKGAPVASFSRGRQLMADGELLDPGPAGGELIKPLPR